MQNVQPVFLKSYPHIEFRGTFGLPPGPYAAKVGPMEVSGERGERKIIPIICLPLEDPDEGDTQILIGDWPQDWDADF